MTHPRPCSRCRVQPASTARNAYCKACRAAYQREWRLRKKGLDVMASGTCAMHARPTDAVEAAEILPRVRLRATPTRAEMLRYRLI